MKFSEYSRRPQNFNSLVKQSLADLAGQTPLQLRHYLKENWDYFVQLSEEMGVTGRINSIIYRNIFRDIKQISGIKPSSLDTENIPPLRLEQIEAMYNDIVEMMPEHKKVTMYALCWGALCNKRDKISLVEYLERDEKDGHNRED